jgi:hypothetical protein
MDKIIVFFHQFSSMDTHTHTHTHTHASISKSASKHPTFHGCINLSQIWTLHQICGKHIQMCMQSITLHSRCGKTRTYKWVIRIYICWIEEIKLAVSQDLMIFWHQLTDLECWICHQLRGKNHWISTQNTHNFVGWFPSPSCSWSRK